jgi:hypothetical protein
MILRHPVPTAIPATKLGKHSSPESNVWLVEIRT